MTLCLAIETSSGDYSIALGDGESASFHSNQVHSAHSPQDLSAMVRGGLHSLGAQFGDIAAIGVDVGPGGLSSTRAGVSFANGLGFSLQVPVHPFSYFEIVAGQVGENRALPLLCAVPAASGNAYFALLAEGTRRCRFGPLQQALLETVSEVGELAVAGRLRDRVCALLPDRRIHDTGIDAPDARILLEMTWRAHREAAGPPRRAIPLNELADEFHGRA